LFLTKNSVFVIYIYGTVNFPFFNIVKEIIDIGTSGAEFKFIQLLSIHFAKK